MAEGPNAESWAQLRSARPQSDDGLAVSTLADIDGNRRVLIGMDQGGDLHLLIQIESKPDKFQSQDLNGLRVRHRRLTTGDVLDLYAPASHEQVFSPFCGEVVSAVVKERRDPSKAVSALIRTWQSAWKPVRAAMDKTTQVGLFGELVVLRSLMIPCLGPDAVYQWCGPDYERHDFVGDTLHVEVKTTRKSRPEHEISRADQLKAPPAGELLFVSVQIEESIGGNETLATLIDEITSAIRGDAAAVDYFMTQLATIGWSEEARRSGDLLRFFMRRVEVYAVDDEFPRMPDEFEVPPGVISFKYTIDLANLPVLGFDEALTRIKRADGDHGVQG